MRGLPPPLAKASGNSSKLITLMRSNNLSQDTSSSSFTLARVAVALFSLLVCLTAGSAASLPEGFAERRVAEGLTGATAMAFAPDGRLFICQQDGRLRVVKNGALLSEPFATFEVDSTGERGLLGVAFDPS